MNTIVPVASGKGGVGKTLLTANLGVALAKRGKTVIVVDLDLGGSNLHTCLGIKNKKPGFGQLIHKQEPSVESLLTDTEVKRLYFIAGDSLLPGTANLPYFRKRSIIRELPQLVADFVLLDLGSGSSYNVVDFFLAGNSALVVITPETTSILNAYSLLKSALFRMLSRTFAAKSREREVVAQHATSQVEARNDALSPLFQQLRKLSADSAELARDQVRNFRPRVVLNTARHRDDLSIGARLRSVSKKNLGIELEYIGVLAADSGLRQSVMSRTPELIGNPTSGYSKGVYRIADRLLSGSASASPQLFDDEEEPAVLPEATGRPFESR